MNETETLQLINAVEALAKEVAENRKQINELIQEVGRLKEMIPKYSNKATSSATNTGQSFNPYQPIIVDFSKP